MNAHGTYVMSHKDITKFVYFTCYLGFKRIFFEKEDCKDQTVVCNLPKGHQTNLSGRRVFGQILNDFL